MLLPSQVSDKQKEISEGYQIIEPRARGNRKFRRVDKERQSEALRRSRIISMTAPEHLTERCRDIITHPERLNEEQQTKLLAWMIAEDVEFGDCIFES